MNKYFIYIYIAVGIFSFFREETRQRNLFEKHLPPLFHIYIDHFDQSQQQYFIIFLLIRSHFLKRFTNNISSILFQPEQL